MVNLFNFSWPRPVRLQAFSSAATQAGRSRAVPRRPTFETGTDDAPQGRDWERLRHPISGCSSKFPRPHGVPGSATKSPPSHVDIVPRPWNPGSGLGSCVTGRDETRLEHVYTAFPPACPDGPVDTSSRYPPFLSLRLRFTPASLQNEADQHHNEW